MEAEGDGVPYVWDRWEVLTSLAFLHRSFTCFASTKVQIVTQKMLQSSDCRNCGLERYVEIMGEAEEVAAEAGEYDPDSDTEEEEEELPIKHQSAVRQEQVVETSYTRSLMPHTLHLKRKAAYTSSTRPHTLRPHALVAEGSYTGSLRPHTLVA